MARQRQDNFTKPPYLNRNEFGGSVGGPVYIPKVYNGRNRTFFFFSWEDIRSFSYTTKFSTVPTEAMRNGDFRGITDSQGRAYNFYDPFTTNPTTYQRSLLNCNGVVNTICPSRESPLAKLPLRNHAASESPDGESAGGPELGRTDPAPAPAGSQDTSASITGSRPTTWCMAASRMAAITRSISIPTSRSSTISPTWIPAGGRISAWRLPGFTHFSNSLTNELLLTGTRDWQRRGSGDFQTNYTGTLMGLPNPFNAPNWPNISGTDLTGYAFGSDGLFKLITNIGTLQDNATKVRGKHEFQFGFQFKLEDVPKNVSSAGGRL